MILKNAKIYLEDVIINNGFLIIENGLIKEIGEGDIDKGIDLNGKAVLPGFIDQHIHGANKYDFMDGTDEAYSGICKYLPREGVTSVVATTITQSKDKILNALKSIASYQQNQNEGETKIVGIHLEGPFINHHNKGAQNEKFIATSNLELFKEFQAASNNQIRLITYAPELDTDYELTKYLLDNNIMPSIGHSSANFKKCEEVVKLGVKNITHFYNGMIPFSHREPGVVNAGLYFDELLCELIVDGIHIDLDVVKATYKIKGPKGIILVSDSIRARGLGNGEYDLGGQNVTVENKKATLASGTIAGSVLNYNDAIKTMLNFDSVNLKGIMEMTAINPAKQLNLYDRIGSIEVGKVADLVVLDHDYTVDKTIINGHIVFER